MITISRRWFPRGIFAWAVGMGVAVWLNGWLGNAQLYGQKYGLWSQSSALLSTNNYLNRAVAIRRDAALSLNLMSILDDQQHLGSGDKITFRVIEDQDDPEQLTVTDAGDLDIPYIGLIHAAGKTCKQLAHEIKAVLEKEYYYQATVILSLEQVNKERVLGKVYVAGQVRNAGAQDLLADEAYTVSKAILKAGGFSDFADKKKVRVVRAAKDNSEKKNTFIVNLADIWEKGQLEKDLPLEPEDLIYVPARLVNW